MNALKARWSLRGCGRDIRVASAGVRLGHRTAPQGKAGEFARAIQARYKAKPAFPSVAERVFGRIRPLITVRPVYHRTQLQFAPSLRLTVLNRLGTQVHRQETVHAVRQVLATIVERNYLERVVHRLMARGERIEAVAAAGIPPASRSGPVYMALQGLDTKPASFLSVPAAMPIPQIVRRSTSVSVESKVTSSAPDREPLISHRGFHERNYAPHTDEPRSININRLTDQVIQAIDRRLLAQRERFGRI